MRKAHSSMAESPRLELHGGHLPADAIDVWHLDLSTPGDSWQCLDAVERARAERLRSAARRLQFVAARGQLRRILASYLDRPADTLEFQYGEHGKPHLVGQPQLSFNLSHSHTRGVLVIGIAPAATGPSGSQPSSSCSRAASRSNGSEPLQLGVDIEFAKPERRFEALAERFFARDDFQALLELPASRRPAAFYRTWTRKEAYLKAWGTGLSFASNRFHISSPQRGRAQLLHSEMPGDDCRNWHFTGIAVPTGYAAAVCYHGEARWLRNFCPVSD